MDSESGARHEPIAIIGMGCRYPGAANVDALWQLLMEGRDAIGEYPGGRLPELDAIYAAAVRGEGSIATHLGGFLPAIDRFDAAFFGISPREAEFIDPQHRLLLEVSWEALEDAGQVREQYQGSRTGVFTGLWTTDYENHLYRTTEHPEFYLLTGGGRSTACGRISFSFGFEGPSISVDTACSSSMVTIHLACQSLQLGECNVALAGGVNVILSADTTRLFTNAGMLARDGRCKFGDTSANGFVRSEGAGMIVLKRLSDAVAAGDGIYAVIHGSSVNNDGRSSGLLVTPSREGQQNMLLEAWKQAGITGGDLSYLEAHGTGTKVGDPVEMGAIIEALRRTGTRGRVPVGSMKTNIGHTESAAGVAGVIKTALVLHHGVIPRSLHLETPNPEIVWADAPVEIVTQNRDLPPGREGKTRMAGVSSFGMTGTNAHTVLGEFTASPRRKETLSSGAVGDGYLLSVSGYTDHALKQNAKNWAALLENDAAGLRELCFVSGARRTHLAHRLAVSAASGPELALQLKAFVEGETAGSSDAGVAQEARPKVVFVAPGQGSQWVGMAQELLRDHAAFREAFTACDHAIAVETGWSLMERLAAPEAAEALKEIDFVQPALFAMSVALAAAWEAAGVKPDAVVGHSMGEVAAAYLAGVLTLEDAAAVICRRSRLMRGLSGSGAMASIEMPLAELTGWLEQFGGRVSVAAENSPGTTVVAGETGAVDQLLEWLELREVYCRRIKVDVASHSILVDPILEALREGLRGIKPRAAKLPLFSTVDACFGVDEGKGTAALMDADYWVRNLRQPVKLAAAVRALAGEGYTCFIELSPHPVLVPAMERTLRSSAAVHAQVLPSLQRDAAAWPAMLRSFGRYWVAGGVLDWAAVLGRAEGPVDHRLRLPQYAFERERFWPQQAAASAGTSRVRESLAPLLRSHTEAACEPGTHLFAVAADLATHGYLKEHRVGGAVVLPASAHLEAALEAMQVLVPGRTAELSDVVFRQALYLAEEEAQELQLVVRRIPGSGVAYSFALMGRQGTSAGDWIEYSSGRMADVGEPAAAFVLVSDTVTDAASGRVGSSEEHYRRAERSGLVYGPAFRLVDSFQVSMEGGVPHVRTELTATAESRKPGYLLHPVLLDSCFQAMIHLRPRIAGMRAEDVYLPAALRKLQVFALPSAMRQQEPEQFVTEAVFIRVDGSADTLEIELRLKTREGRLLAAAEGMMVQRVEAAAGASYAESLFLMDWKDAGTLPPAMPGAAIGRHWLIFADVSPGMPETVAGKLAAELATHAGRCTIVWPGERFKPLEAGARRLDLLGADEYELPLGAERALDQLLGLVAAEAGRISDVIDLWTLDRRPFAENTLDGILAAQERGAKFLPSLVQAMTRAQWAQPPRLWLVTAGTQNVTAAPTAMMLAGSTVWGMGAVLAREHPELRPALIDCSPACSTDEVNSLLRLLLNEGGLGAREDRLALRGKQAFVARLVPCPSKQEAVAARVRAGGERFQAEIERVGTLENLQLRAVQAEAVPAAGEIAIAIEYAGLNFIDVTKAMGIYPGLDPRAPVAMGGECSGYVIDIGADVMDFRVGDRVLALTPSPSRVGLLASHAVLPAALAALVPEGISLKAAAALPIAYLTAHYSLNELARVRKGEWVLIHSGAGGVGLAAARIAIERGARVIATASTPEKRAFLEAWGVEHVLPSRTLDFGDAVMERTSDRGVDVVLNSLAGDYITRSFEVLAPYGRFIELGKRDIHEDRRVGLKAFRKNIAYFAVDLAALIEERPAFAAQLFREVVDAIAAGVWPVLPVETFAAEDVVDAFRSMAQGRHTGKLAVGFGGMAAGNPKLLPAREARRAPLFRRDAAYLITGGLGGVGAAVAEWMAIEGAGHLVLVSRRAAGVEEKQTLRRIAAGGAVAVHRRTDLVDAAAVTALMAEVSREMPPLRGIMHAAAVIDDALVTDLTAERFDPVFGPKIVGTWHLHEATAGIPLDFFMMFSSFAGICPQPGHGSYSAANTFLDAFARYRQAAGLVASSIDWAGWLGLGLAKESGTSRTIEASEAEGLGSFDREEALGVLREAIRIQPAQALAVRIDPDGVIAGHDSVPPLFRELAGVPGEAGPAGGSEEHPILAGLASAANYAERLSILAAMLRTEAGRVLRLAPERIGSHQAFGQLGIDSLMALEFIRRVNGQLGLALPATAVFNYPTLHLLVQQIAKRMGLMKAQDESVAETATILSGTEGAGRNGHRAEQDLSEEEAVRALMQPGEGASGR